MKDLAPDDDPLAVGIDIGTTAVKLIALDSKGTVVFADQMDHDVITVCPGWAEEDPQVWWDHTQELMARLSSAVETRRIRSIGCVGMVPTLICLDEKGSPLGHSIQQNDIRAAAELTEMTSAWDLGDYFEKTGTAPNSQHIYPKLRWLSRHRSDVFQAAHSIMGSYDYIVYKLTGIPGVERNWALESGMWNYLDDRWIPEVLDAGGISEARLPTVRQSQDIVGPLREDLCTQWGIATDTPVIAGSADHVASAFSTGCRREGDLVIKLGGAGDILAFSRTPLAHPHLFLDYHCAGDAYLPNGCMAASGAALKWFKATFSTPEFTQMDDEAESIEPGAEGLVVLPYFLGEKTPIFDTDARGVIYGLTLSHTRVHIYRAFLESIAYAFRHHVDVMEEAGLRFNRVFITNGGSRSTLWRQILADVLGHDLVYVPHHPGSSLGAAILAGMAADLWSDDIVDSILSDAIHVPCNPENRERYEKSYRLYRSLYPALTDTFKASAKS